MKRSQMRVVESTNIDRLGHDGKDLFVAFKSGALYRYPGVPKKVYDSGLMAPSAGRWFRDQVVGKFKHVRLDA